MFCTNLKISAAKWNLCENCRMKFLSFFLSFLPDLQHEIDGHWPDVGIIFSSTLLEGWSDETLGPQILHYELLLLLLILLHDPSFFFYNWWVLIQLQWWRRSWCCCYCCIIIFKGFVCRCNNRAAALHDIELEHCCSSKMISTISTWTMISNSTYTLIMSRSSLPSCWYSGARTAGDATAAIIILLHLLHLGLMQRLLELFQNFPFSFRSTVARCCCTIISTSAIRVITGVPGWYAGGRISNRLDPLLWLSNLSLRLQQLWVYPPPPSCVILQQMKPAGVPHHRQTLFRGSATPSSTPEIIIK